MLQLLLYDAVDKELDLEASYLVKNEHLGLPYERSSQRNALPLAS